MRHPGQSLPRRQDLHIDWRRYSQSGTVNLRDLFIEKPSIPAADRVEETVTAIQ